MRRAPDRNTESIRYLEKKDAEWYRKAMKPLAWLLAKEAKRLRRLWVTVFFGCIASEVKLQERGYDFCAARRFT
jgi:hypothetical protein